MGIPPRGGGANSSPRLGVLSRELSNAPRVLAGRIRYPLFLIALLAALVSRPAAGAMAQQRQPFAAGLPDLQAFVRKVSNGKADQLRGVYAEHLFAAPVVQQPAGYPDFISRGHHDLTEFAAAADLGSTGLLAHNYLLGHQFSQLLPAQRLDLVYGDGRIKTFVVVRLLRYRALQPNSVESDFQDLASGERLSAAALFLHVYGLRGTVVLQTCIASQEISAWGRLFVVAMPVADRGGEIR